MNAAFWNGKRVLVTGHTGFKGSWISFWLNMLGAEVCGYSLDPPAQPNLYQILHLGTKIKSIIGDINNLETLKKTYDDFDPEIIIHMAAQSLVRYSYEHPVETYQTNVMGSLNIMEAARQHGNVRVVVMITTDKCYENKEWVWGYRENDPMGGHDPYSSSKGCAELLIASYRNSYFPPEKYATHQTALASVRAGNVIGGGDWAADRLIPDTIRAFTKNEDVVIRNPDSIRPWQHVLEPLGGYMLLAEKLWYEGDQYSESWNFGPATDDAKPVEWIVKQLANAWGSSASWKIDNQHHLHEANYLKLDCSKVNSRLGWLPRWSLADALDKIVGWYEAYYQNKDMIVLTEKQICQYMEAE